MKYVWILIFLSAMVTSAGCGPAMAPPGAFTAPSSAGQSPGVRSPLLYVAHSETIGMRQDVGVAILSYPLGKRVAEIDLRGYPRGICSDTQGNVWVTVGRSHGPDYVEEFAHGGTTPIAALRMPTGTSGAGCAVDPSSGDLAVTTSAGSYHGSVAVWRGAKKGSPKVYPAPFVALNAAYDDDGNLFVDGVPGGSDFWLEFGQLRRGDNEVMRVSLGRPGASAGGIAWDGTDIAVATGAYHGRRARIYRVHVSSSGLKVVGAVHVRDLNGAPQICIYRGTVVGMAGAIGDRIAAWPYPAGGKPARYITQLKYISGVAISK
jgi:hypothetical protein